LQGTRHRAPLVAPKPLMPPNRRPTCSDVVWAVVDHHERGLRADWV
jgi:hypothetical protein